MAVFDRIIVATDFSPASFAMLTCLGGLQAYGAKRCLLLQCMTTQEVGSVALHYTTAFVDDILAQQKRLLEEQGFEVETRIVPGLAMHEIHRVASEEGYSLVVIGSRGHSLVAEPFLGGVATNMLHRYHETPMLVMRVGADERGKLVCLQAKRGDFASHVLFPTDFSENADRASTYVEQMAAVARRITILHAQDVDPLLTRSGLRELDEIDRARLEEMKTMLEKRGGAAVEIEVRSGSPFLEITRMIPEREVSLVVMGSQGRGFIKELFLGSVSHNVVRHAQAPVLLIPAPRGDS